MSSSGVAYDPDDPSQQALLSSLAQGETGNSAFASSEGVGGSNLAGDPTDAYGFPQWEGEGNSHAAGTYQFQPGTWDAIAQKYNLNFGNSSDQSAGAWYEAQQDYSQETGGQSLETAIQNGNYSQIQSALENEWPSVSGNQAQPQGLASALASNIASGGTPTSASGNVPPPTDQGQPGAPANNLSSIPYVGGWLGDIEDFFVRFGLIIIGVIIVAVALWELLSSQGVVPSPTEVGKAAVAAV